MKIKFTAKVQFTKLVDVEAETLEEVIQKLQEQYKDHGVYKHWYEHDGAFGCDLSEWHTDKCEEFKKTINVTVFKTINQESSQNEETVSSN